MVESGNRTLSELLAECHRHDASDIHLTPGYPITIRVHGKLGNLGSQLLEPAEVESMIQAILPERLKMQLADVKDFDCSHTIDTDDGPVRYRANVFLAQNKWCACLRHIPEDIPSFDWMGFPMPLAERLINYKNGLVVITGVTGSGKSTTLAGLIDLINHSGGSRVITVEQPIEYVHHPRSSTMVTQREVGRDVDSFFDGLKYGLRQDPDVILVGEIRDRETARMALSAAETGHLIFATMHTQDAKGAITRFTDLFPYDAQSDVRTQLALSLRTVVNQHLLPSSDPDGKRALALEVLHVNQPVKAVIRSGKVESIESAIQTGKRDGMVSLDEDLMRLAMAQRISVDTARRFAKDPSQI